MSDTAFQAGERLEWHGPTEIKIVTFHSIDDKDNATVGFGRRSDFSEVLWSCPLKELRRTTPPVRQEAFLPGPPPAEIPIDIKRELLKSALAELHRATEAVATATSAANRAQRHVLECHSRLRVNNALEAQATEKLVADLTANGHSEEPHDSAWAEHEMARRNASLAEAAYAEIARKLSEAKNTELQCRIQVERATRRVTGGVLDNEIANLAKLELQAAELRTKLKAQIGFYPETLEGTPQPIPISSASAAVIHNPPNEIRDPIGYETRAELQKQRQAPIAELYSKLLAGEIDADLE